MDAARPGREFLDQGVGAVEPLPHLAGAPVGALCALSTKTIERADGSHESIATAIGRRRRIDTAYEDHP